MLYKLLRSAFILLLIGGFVLALYQLFGGDVGTFFESIGDVLLDILGVFRDLWFQVFALFGWK